MTDMIMSCCDNSNQQVTSWSIPESPLTRRTPAQEAVTNTRKSLCDVSGETLEHEYLLLMMFSGMVKDRLITNYTHTTWYHAAPILPDFVTCPMINTGVHEQINNQAKKQLQQRAHQAKTKDSDDTISDGVSVRGTSERSRASLRWPRASARGGSGGVGGGVVRDDVGRCS